MKSRKRLGSHVTAVAMAGVLAGERPDGSSGADVSTDERPSETGMRPSSAALAVRNVYAFRWAIECCSALVYIAEPRLRDRADRLVDDLAVVGAHPFAPVVNQLVHVGVALQEHETWNAMLVDIALDLEVELLDLEARDRSLWGYLMTFRPPRVTTDDNTCS